MSKPNLQVMANGIDRNVTEATGGGTYGAFIDVILPILSMFLQQFLNCPAKQNPPAPANPATTPTPEQTQAWNEAWGLKCRANAAYNEETADYDGHTLRLMARNARRQRRKSGEPVTMSEALEIARSALDQTRGKEMPDLAAAVIEAKEAA